MLLKREFLGGAFILITCTLLALFLQQWIMFFVPVAIVLFFLLLQKPLFFFYTLLLSIPWSVEYNFSSSLGTDLPDEPLMLLNAAVVVLYMVFNWRTLFIKKWFHPLLLLLAVQFTWSIITVFFSTNVFISTKYLLAKSWYLLSFVAIPVLFFKSKKDLNRGVILFACSLMLVVFVVLIRHLINGFTFTTINQSLQPFFRNHVTYSALLVCLVPLLVALWKGENNRWIKVVMVIFLIMAIAAVYLSYARGAWLAVFVGLFVYWLLAKGLLVKGFVAFLVICILSVAWLQYENHYLEFAPQYKTTIFHTDFSEHLLATYEGKDVSTAERFYRWIAGFNMVAEKPVAGFGPNTFYQNYKSYTIPLFKTWVSNNEDHSTVHNYFLLVLIEQGVPGLLFFLLLVGYAFHRAQHIYKTATDKYWKHTAACIAVLLSMICTVNFLSDLIETDKMGSVFYTSIGILIFMDYQIRKLKLSPNVEGIA